MPSTKQTKTIQKKSSSAQKPASSKTKLTKAAATLKGSASKPALKNAPSPNKSVAKTKAQTSAPKASAKGASKPDKTRLKTTERVKNNGKASPRAATTTAKKKSSKKIEMAVTPRGANKVSKTKVATATKKNIKQQGKAINPVTAKSALENKQILPSGEKKAAPVKNRRQQSDLVKAHAVKSTDSAKKTDAGQGFAAVKESLTSALVKPAPRGAKPTEMRAAIGDVSEVRQDNALMATKDNRSISNIKKVQTNGTIKASIVIQAVPAVGIDDAQIASSKQSQFLRTAPDPSPAYLTPVVQPRETSDNNPVTQKKDTPQSAHKSGKPVLKQQTDVEPVSDTNALQSKTPKPANQKLGFKTNEFVVYPAHGVGQIIAIEEQEVAGFKLELFVISFIKDKMILKVPTPKVVSVGMRKLSEGTIVTKALDTLTGRARIKRTMWSRRAQEYEAKINSGDLIAIAEVVRDLYRSEAQPEQSYSERQLYEAALERVSRELSVVQKTTEQEALKLIDAQLQKGPKRGAKTEAEGDADGDIEEAA